MVLLPALPEDVKSCLRPAKPFIILFWEYNHLATTGEGMSQEG